VAPAELCTGEQYPFFLPVNIFEAQARDLSGANPVHRKYHNDRVISNHRGLISRSGIENLLDNFPGRAGWEALPRF
jgi:hypothetical protein